MSGGARGPVVLPPLREVGEAAAQEHSPAIR